MLKVITLLIISLPLFGQKVIIKGDSSMNITSQMEVFSEQNSEKAFEEIRKQNFLPFHQSNYIEVASDRTHWLKITIENASNVKQELLLNCTESGIEHLDFYMPNNNGEYEKIEKGALIKAEHSTLTNKTPIANFQIEPKTTKVFYINLYGSKSLLFQVWLLTQQKYQDKIMATTMQNGILLGALVIRFFYMILFMLFAIKDRIFKIYTIHVFCGVIVFMSLYGIFGQLFTQNQQNVIIINTLARHFYGFVYLLFTFALIPLKRFHPIIKYLLIAGMIINVAIAGLLSLNYNWLWVRISIEYTVFTWFPILVIFVYAKLKKIPINWYYALPFLIGSGSYAFMRAITAGWFNGNIFGMIAFTTLLFVAELIFFGYFIGNIIRVYEKNKILSEQKLTFNIEQSKRLSELDNLKTRFFTNISHEFRTPLNLLVGPIDDLQKKYPQEGIISVMQRNLQRLQSLINQILDLSKLEAGEMIINLKEVDFPKFLDQFFASFESLAQSKSIIFNHSQSSLSQLGLFDLDKLEKIITNLLSNAFKFTPENGRINVRVEYLENYILIIVQDFGIGISSEKLPHIFDRFYQVDDGTQPLQEGTGIGLSLVKELVDLLKGQINVSSIVGEGTVFTLNLPFEPISNLSKPMEQFVVRNNPEAVFNDIQKVNGFKVEEIGQPIMLVVEDNPDLRNYIASIFESQYQLVMAVDGEEGLTKAIEYIPDIVISDLMMPKLDGLGFCEMLKNDERINHIPVIMLTAKASMSDKLIGLKHGADDYLSKPFNKEELIVRVNNLVNQRQLMREKYVSKILGTVPKIEVIKELTMDELFIQKATKVIDKYLDKSEFDVEKFANDMNLSSVQLRRKLKAITDQNVIEFVRNYRLEIASNMLKKGEGTVSEIAYQVGFDSLSYFSKVFFEKYNKMPSEWL